MHGLLFTTDFLREGIRETPGWSASEAEFVDFRARIQSVFRTLDTTALNEAQTEDEVIVPVLEALGWTRLFLRQANASRTGREDVPDFLLFPGDDAKKAALALPAKEQDRRFRHGAAILEAKRWDRPLDRSDPLDPGTPSSQMLRYLSRVDVASDRALKWGMLSNGRIWRLYWQDARSRAEEYLEFDLQALAGVAALTSDLFAPSDPNASVHLLRAFFLLFRREAFLPQPGDGRSFHAIALDESRLWESRVSQDLGQRVFDEVFPRLTAALVRHDPAAPQPPTAAYLDEVHRGALVLLYRLLFVLYAEDRNLLPVHDRRYDDYSLRWLRNDIARRADAGDAFSTAAARAWGHLDSLFRAIDHGDDALGLPAYNGGLFRQAPDSLLARVQLPDAELCPLIDILSRRQELSGAAWINYRDLAVQHLGSIYERLLEQRLAPTDDGGVAVRPSPFARKSSGSYYTHDDLVKLILREALAPLVAERVATFDAAIERAKHERDLSRRISILTEHDPAEALLRLKVCDPAMGSGHFLVSLVDDLADRVLEQIADAQAKARSIGVPQYQSRLATDLAALRERILSRASAGHWAIDPALLDDRHLVRRMLLKRVVHGADKNPMAVELAKLALWLHTFTVGAPLSFLDHHLRCGDALFGERLATVRRDLNKLGGLFNDSQVAGLLSAARTFAEISGINDVDLEEVERSRELMEQADGTLDGLKRVFDLWQALRWVAPLDVPKRLRGWKQDAVAELLSGRYRLTLMELLRGEGHVQSDDPTVDGRVNALLDECRALARAEGFLHWELAFPSAWPGLPDRPEGGFDAIVGNPPWDRMKLQEVEWFADRKPEIALQGRAADRKAMVAALRTSGDPLAADYDRATQRAEDAARVARSCGEYPLLSGGDVNLYSLFVERADALVAPTGVVGLLVPSGIAGDKGASAFFRSISTSARLGTLIDFENRKVFFPDVHASFKFSALVFGGKDRRFEATCCAFYVQRMEELEDPDRLVQLDPAAFAAINPNTGTAPIFRTARDAELTARIYATNPVLVRYRFQTRPNRDGEEVTAKIGEDRLYQVRYCTMFHMTNDSASFNTEQALADAGAYKVAPNRWKSPDGDFVPLYEGKMVQAYDHRAASVVVNPDNLHRPAQPLSATDADKEDPAWLPSPQFWVPADRVTEVTPLQWHIAFKDVTAPTNVRTMIAAIVPLAGYGNTLPVLIPDDTNQPADVARKACYLLANLNAMALDYCARQKVQGQHLNWYIVSVRSRHLPVAPRACFDPCPAPSGARR